MPSFQTEMWLTASLEDVWNFHRDPHNLALISPAFLKLAFDDVPKEMGPGATFFIRSQNHLLRPFLGWTTTISDWDEKSPDCKMFIDTQSGGPFQSWHHRHDFVRGTTELHAGEKNLKPKFPGVWIKDSVEYVLKPQLRAFELIAAKALTRFFVFRKRALTNIFLAPSDGSTPPVSPVTPA